jgi:hypothetical protein
LSSPYQRHADGSIGWIDLPNPGSDLAGVETTRQTFWGSPTSQALGLTLVTKLAQMDVWAEGSDLALLEREIAILLAHLDLFPGHEDYWHIRLTNVQTAIQLAKQVPDAQGGVYIG